MKTKNLPAILLTLSMIIASVIGIGTTVNAEDNPYNYSGEPSRAIYYVLPTMKGNDVKWVQAALNSYGGYGLAVDGSFGPACREATRKFQASMGMSQDGSFGPATRSAMVNWLSSNGCKASGNSSNNSSSKKQQSSKITTSQIQAILNKYGYVSGSYWNFEEGGSPTSNYRATYRGGRENSYRYNGKECYGFVNFIMHEVTGTDVNPNNGNANGWTKLSPNNVSELRVGDIVRIGKDDWNGHTGLVFTTDGNANNTFIESWGSYGNQIHIDSNKMNSSSFGSPSSLSAMKSSGVLLYVYRYTG